MRAGPRIKQVADESHQPRPHRNVITPFSPAENGCVTHGAVCTGDRQGANEDPKGLIFHLRLNCQSSPCPKNLSVNTLRHNQ